MTRILKVMVIALILGGLAVPSASCASKSSSASLPSEVVTVARGNLSVEITGSGNLVLSVKQDLGFEVSGTDQDPVSVREVLIKEGDLVKKGQVLVRVDTTALEQRVTDRERTVKQTELSARNTEMAATTAEIDFQTTTRDAEQAVRTAEISLETATDNYRKVTYPYTARTFVYDAPAAINAIHDAEINLEKVKTGLGKEPSSGEYSDIGHQLTLARDSLTQARERLSLGLDPELFKAGTNSPLAVGTVWSLRAAQFAVESAQLSLDKAKASYQSSLDKAKLSLDKAKVSLDQAKLSLEVAREDLNNDKDDLKKVVIVAPFDGWITKLNVSGGENVKRGMVAATIADPDKFEANILVNEMDILQVKLGASARVQVEAMPELNLSANVTAISPTATIQSGVVNYKVTVAVQSLQSLRQERQKAMQQEPGLPSGQQRPTPTPRATPRPTPRATPRAATPRTTLTPTTTIPEDLQLREGLTVTVNIPVAEKKDVLLVPNEAITRQGSETYVQVQKDGGVIERRSIKTGMSNWTQTEITEGLSEGEKVVVPKGTTSTTTSQRQQPPLMIPGLGGVRK